MYAKGKLDDIYSKTKESMHFIVANREFEPDSVATSDIVSYCKPGMKSQDGQCGE